MSDYKTIALSIAHELTEHPERWRSDGKYGRPVLRCHCLAQHIAIRGGFDLVQGDYTNADEEGIFDAFESEMQGFRSIMDWNDNPERTVADVIALCNKVAGVTP